MFLFLLELHFFLLCSAKKKKKLLTFFWSKIVEVALLPDPLAWGPYKQHLTKLQKKKKKRNRQKTHILAKNINNTTDEAATAKKKDRRESMKALKQQDGPESTSESYMMIWRGTANPVCFMRDIRILSPVMSYRIAFSNNMAPVHLVERICQHSYIHELLSFSF